MRRNWQSNRIALLLVLLLACSGLMFVSIIGLLSPVENIAATPLNLLTRGFTRVSLALQETPFTYQDVVELQDRVAELEDTLARQQGELILLREVASDYDRLAELLDYTTATENTEYVTADVIGSGQFGIVQSIIINRGTRDGLAVGMPVVTQLGLVGRIFDVSANAAQVQLVTDQNSNVSGRLQSSRAEGAVAGRGLETGDLRMRFIPPDATVTIGDLVVTSGLGGNFPADLVIGQVTSVTNLEFELSQSAQIASLINFDTLEFVLVITSFEPADISVFDTPEDEQEP